MNVIWNENPLKRKKSRELKRHAKLSRGPQEAAVSLNGKSQWRPRLVWGSRSIVKIIRVCRLSPMRPRFAPFVWITPVLFIAMMVSDHEERKKRRMEERGEWEREGDGGGIVRGQKKKKNNNRSRRLRQGAVCATSPAPIKFSLWEAIVPHAPALYW